LTDRELVCRRVVLLPSDTVYSVSFVQSHPADAELDMDCVGKLYGLDWLDDCDPVFDLVIIDAQLMLFLLNYDL